MLTTAISVNLGDLADSNDSGSPRGRRSSPYHHGR
jgi:hypothetical protein